MFSKLRFAALGLIILTAITYGSSLSNSFVALDDNLLIYQNPAIQGMNAKNLKTIFTTFDPELYIPLTLLSYQIEYQLFGLDAYYYHLTNLLLHIGSSILLLYGIYFLVRRIYTDEESFWMATVAALIFALHPLNTEVVAWAAARKDQLSSFFMLLSLLLYVLYRDSNDRFAYGSAVVAFLLALASKVSVVIFPVALCLIEWLIYKRRDRSVLRDAAPFFVLSFIFGFIGLFGKKLQISELGPIDQLLLGAKSSIFYIQKFFVPTGLSIFYPHDGAITLLRSDIFIPVLLVIVLLGCAYLLYRRNQSVAVFGMLFFFMAIAPSFFNFWKNGFIYFADDRYAYLAHIGLSLALLSFLVPAILQTRLKRSVSAFILVCAVGVWMTLSFHQAQTWANSETLYIQTLKYNPQSAHAYNNLGSTYFTAGRLDEAEAMYQKGLEADPYTPQIYVNLGKLAMEQGDHQKAIELFQQSVEFIPENRILLPEDLVGYYFLGTLFEELGRTEEGIEAFRQATAQGPNDAQAFHNYGTILQKYARNQEAADVLRRAVELNPQNLESHYRLAAVLAETGQLAEAAEHLQYIVRRAPNYQQAAEHLERIRVIIDQ